MKLKVKNFGPIREAEVDLKPLTVFVGPSNTGKSYLAMLLYSVAKALDDANRHIIRELELYFRDALRKQKSWDDVVGDDKRFAPVVAKAMPLFARMFRMVWEYEARRCFGEEWKSIVKSNGKWPVSISVESGNGVVLDLFHSRKNKFPGTAEMVRHIRSMLKVADTRKQKRGERREFFEPSVECAHGIFGAMRFLPNPPSGDSVHYLPAIRGGIMQRHLMMVGTIVGGAARTNVPGSDLPVNGVLADFLQKLVYVGNDGIPMSARKYNRIASRARSGKPESEAGQLSRTIEREILGGKIVEKRSETGYTDFRYKFASHGKERNVQLMNASSSISELAPLVVFMRHYLEPPGDIFIVEEPEAHLHPAAQRYVAGVLAKLVKSGVYVVVTTHSDMILEQLSNFVHAHGYPETNLLNEKSGERTIHQNQTAVYSFVDTHPDKGTAVRKIDFDEDTGMVTRDHLDESSDLYNETVDIFNTKQERAANDN